MKPLLYPAKTQGIGHMQIPSLMAECSAALHSFSNPSLFIDFALDSILVLADANSGSFLAWNEYSKELVLEAARGSARDRIQNLTIKLREGIAGWVAENGTPILVKDIRTDTRFRETNRNFSYHSFSFLSLPIIAGNKLLGVINITERENLRPFNEEDLIRAQTFSNHVAIAYENVRTETRLRKENQELSQTISDLKEKLKQQESFVSLGKLASQLAHELTNPLDAIRRFINLALDQITPETPAREYLLKAKRGVRRSIQVIRGLLELSRTTAKVRAHEEELHFLIDETITTTHQDSSFEQITFEKEFFESPLLVEDCGLRSVFQNLFQNAHHAMNGIGTITIATKREGQQIIISVSDSGHGIPEGIKGSVFEPFFTTKDNGQGTGIGLTICREIIQKCGGQICLGSSEREGTRFIITLPCKN
ncbi:MAG: hypothetical protein A3C35_03405 [Omnitrophica bacterium RIFCSPHIGHO2_02_FULL_46_11]|nr:MAG: hypothetical protein A3A81_05045 [Omnitrophica bacterium RIFCSPLOWO2_01_FULL_45_10b]OGW85778.1 MAG: hypothetical protein A3C35_03405 [Omnitrophica bacterium RIFCSPHIGHO2_02_FULL_46_11]